MNHIFTWTDAKKYIFGNSIKNEKDLCLIFTYARQFGIGKGVSFQKTAFSETDLEILRVVSCWWSLLNDITNIEFRDKVTTRNILRTIFSSIKYKKTIHTIGIFCPSYKKGVGEFGYTGKLGSHSKQAIKQMIEFIDRSNEMGLGMNGTAYFSDLLLENFKKLQGTEYKLDLEKNFLEFRKEFEKSNFITVKRLSDVTDLKAIIGEEGPKPNILNKIENGIYRRVLSRNMVFYKDELGWTESMVKNRTDILYSAYAIMGEYFYKIINGNGLMFWTESAYERGVLYNTPLPDGGIPIIYPKKQG